MFSYQWLISRLHMVAIFIFWLCFLGQKWGQKLTKSEIICVNLWSFLCFWQSFGGMGSPASLFQHMWKLDNLLTFSYDCGSFDHFQKLFLVNVWSFFCWPCYCQYLNNCLELLHENAKLLKSIFPWRAQHSDNILFFIFFNQIIIFNNTIIGNILPNMCLILLNWSN